MVLLAIYKVTVRFSSMKICISLVRFGKAGPLGQKSIFFILLVFNNKKLLLKYFSYSNSAQVELFIDIWITAIQLLLQICQVKTFLLDLVFGRNKNLAFPLTIKLHNFPFGKILQDH